jgi:hypothetical protein
MSTNWLPLIGLLALAPAPLQAHDIYSHLVDDMGRSCCNDTDCRPAHYRVRATGVEMLVVGQWIAVPFIKTQYRALAGDTGETGGGHWCGTTYEHWTGIVYRTRCVVLPPQSAAVTGAVP